LTKNVTNLAASVMSIALLAGTLCTAVEFFKLYHSPALDGFRLTIPGMLLLGRTFSVWDLAAYWVAISFGTILDKVIRPAAQIK
jgi:hypothetical protein